MSRIVFRIVPALVLLVVRLVWMTMGVSGQPGQSDLAHSIATDSKGNIYTTESYEGRRLQHLYFYQGA